MGGMMHPGAVRAALVLRRDPITTGYHVPAPVYPR